MFTKYQKRMAISPKQLLSGNKTPNPTNFSNTRSQLYLSPTDIENFTPNGTQFRSRVTLDGSKTHGRELLIEDPFALSEHSVNDVMIPHTSKPVQCKLGNWSKRDSSQVASPKMEKLSPKHLPPANEGDLNASVMTIESCVDPDRDMKESIMKDKYPINLEQLVGIEMKLWRILEGLHNGTDVISFCKEWWDLTNNEWFLNIYKVFKDDKTQNGIKRIQIQISLAVALAEYLKTDPQLSSVCVTQLKSLIFSVHQNYLLLCDFIYRKLPSETSQNIWANQLQATVMNKRVHKYKKGDELLALSKNVEFTGQIISCIRKTAFSALKRSLSASQEQQSNGLSEPVKNDDKIRSTLLNCIGTISKKAEKFTPSQARGLLAKSLEAALSLINRESLVQLGAEASEEKELSLVEAPYLACELHETTYTLVLDLDETLIHYFETENEGHVLVRPGVEEFLQEMSKYYELVVFTAALQEYADWVLDEIDPSNYIKHRLFRQHTIRNGSVFIKDLSRIGRSLSKTIIIDNVADNFQLQPENGILIRSWIDDSNDTALEELTPLLKEIVIKRVADVREALGKFSSQMSEQSEFGVCQYHFSLDPS